MSWEKSSEAVVAQFDRMVPEAPAVERRQMFGYPAAFVNGNLFMSLFKERMVLRLSEQDRDAFLAAYDTELFDPMGGRPMKHYCVVPPVVQGDEPLLQEWIGKALSYVSGLPKKEKKPRKAKARSKAKKTGA